MRKRISHSKDSTNPVVYVKGIIPVFIGEKNTTRTPIDRGERS